MSEQPLRIGILGAARIAERAIVEPARGLDGVLSEGVDDEVSRLDFAADGSVAQDHSAGTPVK